MDRGPEKLLAPLLTPPADDREVIAAALVASLQSPDASYEPAWAAEIERRANATDSGEAEATDIHALRLRIEKEILHREGLRPRE
jgi:putative addiction module component (TIGR02574 family)